MSGDTVEKVRALEKYLHLTRNEFGRRMGMPPASAGQLEKRLDEENIIGRICRTYRVNPAYFTDAMTAADVARAVPEEMEPGAAVRRLRNVREMRGLNQTELAKKMGMSQQLISAVEGGERRMSAAFAGKAAEVLDVGTDYLLCGDENRRDNPVNETMVRWLWNHAAWREKIRQEMRREAAGKNENERAAAVTLRADIPENGQIRKIFPPQEGISEKAGGKSPLENAGASDPDPPDGTDISAAEAALRERARIFTEQELDLCRREEGFARRVAELEAREAKVAAWEADVKNARKQRQNETSIVILHLSNRARNALDRYGIETVGELVAAAERGELYQIPGIGNATLREILKAVKNAGGMVQGNLYTKPLKQVKY